MDAYRFEGRLFQIKDSPLLSCAPFAEMKSCEALFAVTFILFQFRTMV